ncbi:MAG: pentapeptide repeat-containing protein [Candidatus Acidiferrales bacterium]
MLPFCATEWSWEWVAYFLSNWKFLEVLEYLGSLSVLVAVLFYFSESGDRTKQRHYQAWQVVNTAQGKGGSGGRIEALQELSADHVPLVGVDVSHAFLQGIRLERANLLRSNLSAADLRDSDLRSADLTESNLRSANLRGGDLRGVSLLGADLRDSDITGADLTDADLSAVILDNADLTGVNLQNIQWRGIRSLAGANLENAKNPPPGFLEWATHHGAVQTAGEE